MMTIVHTTLALACFFSGASRKMVHAEQHGDPVFSSAKNKPITIRGGVLLAPPFAIADASAPNGYTGFQGDLLERLKNVASQDGYDLKFDLSLSPPQYGAALDLVASDCNTTSNPNSLENCSKFDLIIGDYYYNAERSVRVDFSPSWLQTTMSTIKTIKDEEDVEAMRTDYTTLTQVQEAGGTACVPEGTYLKDVVMEKFPKVKYNSCPDPEECISRLKSGKCSLYADDELALRYRALSDLSLQITGEQFNTQYIVWPMSYSLDQTTSKLLKMWLYKSVSNATLDELYDKYFTFKLCPLGKAGEMCDINCDPKHGLSDREGTCICNSIKWTGDDCSIEVKEDLNLYPAWEVITCYAFFFINALACFGFTVWVYIKRDMLQVKVWQPYFLDLVLLGCFLCSASIIPLTQQSAGDGPVYACTVFPWLYCVGFSITFSTLFAKMRRVFILFRGTARFERVSVTQKETYITICAITSVDVIICAIWTSVDPLVWVREVTATDQFGEPVSSAGYCTSEHWPMFIIIIGFWHLFLMVLACVISYQSRHISTNFSEGKHLLVAMISTFQIYIISMPVMKLIGADPIATLFIRVAVIWISNFAVLSIIFGGLVYSVYRPTDDIHWGNAISEYSRKTDAEADRRASHAKERPRANSGEGDGRRSMVIPKP